MHVVAVEALDAGSDVDAAVVDEMQQLSVDHGAVAVQVAGGGRGEGVAFGPAERDIDQAPGHALLQAYGQAGEQRQLRARPAEQRLGLEDQSVADRHVRLVACLRGVDGEVAAGVAGAHDQDAPALQVVGVAVAAGVQDAALEASGVVGHEWVP